MNAAENVLDGRCQRAWEYLARMGGTVPTPFSREIGDNQTGRQESEETASWVTPLQVAAKPSATAPYINEVLWNAQDVQVVERLEGYIGGRPSASLIASM